MSQANFLSQNATSISNELKAQVGVGLRHPHYQEALSGTSSIDFVEIHAENFFAEGGLTTALLNDISKAYKVSLHATSLGLGSAIEINPTYLNRLKKLVDSIDPWLVSDHACFTWSHQGQNNNFIHAGDLLPIDFSPQSLRVLERNVDRVQQLLGRPILIENISSYIEPNDSHMSEEEFLSSLAERTQCRLLIDLNNLLVNAHNFSDEIPIDAAKQWLKHIPTNFVGEFHLAGCTPVKESSLLIDDHAEPVSEECWSLYRFAIERFGLIPTLIEWDNNLPSWDVLIDQATTARHIAQSINLLTKG